MPEEVYEFTESTYTRLAQAGVAPLSVLDVLYADRRVRRHIGSSLQIAGHDRAGVWLAVALIEGADDRYVVTSARYLDDDEIAVVSRLLGGQR